jgi:nucleotide-binding universal stress UspA family protein
MPLEAAMIRSVKKILAPIDFSDHSFKAMRGAYELANDVGAELHLVHVVAPYHLALESRELAREAAMVDEVEKELVRIKADQLGDSKKVVTSVVVGPPYQKIIDYAKENGIDLIVVATHGRTGLEHMLIGSVTEKLVRNAPCAVIVLPSRA